MTVQPQPFCLGAAGAGAGAAAGGLKAIAGASWLGW